MSHADVDLSSSKTGMSATQADGVGRHDEKSLLVSKLHKIGGSDDDDEAIRLILASQSPRRREILDMMGLSGRYTATPSPLDESALQLELSNQPHVPPETYARTLAEHKAEALGLHLLRDDRNGNRNSAHGGVTTFILGSDTIVDLDGIILEKPIDEKDARDMLGRLSGRWHKVHTGVAIYSVIIGNGNDKPTFISSFTDTARVKFAQLSKEDVNSYVGTGEPMDKAGSYGIQGVGGQLVERMEGDFFTVMGLPMHRLSRELSRAISSVGI